ncbi:PREDICTED: uncharacterized protein LOC108611831 [Drosophila arizonae]|uniref:Uncharacterized protein LOC108611831 n=1 Tax=Drosophila arizonae TaxID=7263 RepID=A0ABM1NYU5_DROAR|nr:PREDICTED: uncharacterized protein LOC108611831 [Drosophila arizonae]
MPNEKQSKVKSTVLQFSSAAGSPETKRKMLLYRQLLQREIVRDMRPRQVVRYRHPSRQQQVFES